MEQEWYRRGHFTPLSLLIGTKACFLFKENYAPLHAQIIVLIVAGILLWQILHCVKRKDIPQEEPLGEQRAKYLTQRLTGLSVCAVTEAALMLTQIILRLT